MVVGVLYLDTPCEVVEDNENGAPADAEEEEDDVADDVADDVEGASMGVSTVAPSVHERTAIAAGYATPQICASSLCGSTQSWGNRKMEGVERKIKQVRDTVERKEHL